MPTLTGNEDAAPFPTFFPLVRFDYPTVQFDDMENIEYSFQTDVQMPLRADGICVIGDNLS